MNSNLTIGVMALQGDFEMHVGQLSALGISYKLIKLPEHLDNVDALILPGGESTTMDKLIDRFDLRQPLLDFSQQRPIFGTCAGMILLAKEIDENQSNVKPLGLIDISVLRNGYGRQVFSFDTELHALLDGKKEKLTASFIRAPKVTRVGDNVEVLAEFDNTPVLVAERRFLAASFHTELETDTVLLEYFLNRFL